MTNTTTSNIDKIAILTDHSKAGKLESFHYTVANFKAADYNAEYEIPEYYMIEREQMISGLKYTFYKSTEDDCSAVKIENENWGITVSFYEKGEWTAEFEYEIEK